MNSGNMEVEVSSPGAKPLPARQCAIQTTWLGRRFGNHWAVRELSLNVPRGSVYGFLGLNGAGKSTTIRMLMGLLSPTEGSMSVLGADPSANDLEVKRRVGYVPDMPNFYEWMTVEEICAFVAHYRKGAWDARRAEHLVKFFRLPRQQKLQSLSKGQRSKVSLTLALAFGPELLILDEPTGGLDPIARREFLQGVLAEFMEGDKTIFISSHLIHEISGLVDFVGILHEGKLVRESPVEPLLNRMRRVKLFYECQAPRTFACEGLLRFESSGREAMLAIEGFDPERTPADLDRLGAAQVVIENLTLEEAFVEIAGSREEEDQ